MRAVIATLALAILMLVLAGLSANDWPAFEQGTCSGPSWYRDPVTMSFALDCARLSNR